MKMINISDLNSQPLVPDGLIVGDDLESAIMAHTVFYEHTFCYLFVYMFIGVQGEPAYGWEVMSDGDVIADDGELLQVINSPGKWQAKDIYCGEFRFGSMVYYKKVSDSYFIIKYIIQHQAPKSISVSVGRFRRISSKVGECFVSDDILDTTRQSEMANISPCHIPVLGNVPPIFFVT